MARFFVGQRVRIVGVDETIPGHLLGKTAIVTEIMDCFWDGIPLYGLDCFPIVEDSIFATGFDPSQLEPILPAHQPVAIADLLSEFPSLSNALGVSA